ncbi:hypothetical protein Acr_18g0007040 [Actinidia rufa]|uniref:Uncharacterized protein n=1 Tax=Actinidia rufa TaxID=165716 RepID=A0A7J0G6W1_9ERIC|nr:hypothetical protein Acr_18g0007040 [Actinidia rufa]
MGLSKNFGVLSPDIPRNCRWPLPLVQVYSMAIILSLLNNYRSKVKMSSARIAAVFDSVCTELQRKGPPSLLYSDSSAEAPCPSKANVFSLSSDAEDHRVYFIMIAWRRSLPCPNKENDWKQTEHGGSEGWIRHMEYGTALEQPVPRNINADRGSA